MLNEMAAGSFWLKCQMNPAEAFEESFSHPPTLHDIPWGGACTVD